MNVAFCFGRYNPPHKGHAGLFESVSQYENGIVFASQSQDPTRNPLPFDRKMHYLKEMFPGVKFNQDKSIRTFLEAAKHLNERYDELTFVAGEDDLQEMGEILVNYNGLAYNFVSIQLQEAPRITSATSLRESASGDDFESFREQLPEHVSEKLARNLFQETRENLYETASYQDIRRLKAYLDRLWNTLGMDVEFTRHFVERLRDPRNRQPISTKEIARLFSEVYRSYGKPIAQLGPAAQGVLTDMQTDVNVPFVLDWDNRTQELELISKTVMRKPNFRSSNKQYRV